MSESGSYFFIASDYDANELVMIQNNKHRNRTLLLLQIIVLFSFWFWGKVPLAS